MTHEEAKKKQVVFVVNDGQHVLGVYTTKEKAQARATAYARGNGEMREWHRYDGAWQFFYRPKGASWLTMRVTECEVEE